MNITFINGTDLQKQVCRTVAHNLLNFPFDEIPLQVTIEFTPDPSPFVQHEYMVTAWSYGSVEPFTKINDKAPNWRQPGSPNNDIRFFQESVAHEYGHGMFAALPEPSRIAIAQMFGAKSDAIEELAPAGAAWEDKIIEGIAETFKDAFLPRRYRLFSNRTNHKIPYSKFPEFRRLFRSFGSSDVTIEADTRIPMSAGETFAYNFVINPEPWFTHFPVDGSPPAELPEGFSYWEVWFIWTFWGWFQGGKISDGTQIAFTMKYRYVQVGGEWIWKIATGEFGDPTKLTISDTPEFINAGIVSLSPDPGVPLGKFTEIYFSPGDPWASLPLTISQSFTAQEDDLFSFQSSVSVSGRAWDAAHGDPAAVPGLIYSALPAASLGGVPVFGIGGLDPGVDNVFNPNHGLRSYNIDSLPAYEAQSTLPFEDFVVPGETHDITPPTGVVLPAGGGSGAQPHRRPVTGNIG